VEWKKAPASSPLVAQVMASAAAQAAAPVEPSAGAAIAVEDPSAARQR
jgi:hypothetical protein